MPSNRPNLSLDEQFFQELLSAAYTIQQHNDSLDHAEPLHTALETSAEAQPKIVCPQCGGSKPSEEAPCEHCGPGDFRRGERLQRNWASMWLMSQEQGLWPERASEDHATMAHMEGSAFDVKRGTRSAETPDLAASGILATPFDQEVEKGKGASDRVDVIPHSNDGQIDDHPNGNHRIASSRNSGRQGDKDGKNKNKDRQNGDHRNGNGQGGSRRNGNGHDAGKSAGRIEEMSAVMFEGHAPVSNWAMDGPLGAAKSSATKDEAHSEDAPDLTPVRSTRPVTESASDDLLSEPAGLTAAEATDTVWDFESATASPLESESPTDLPLDVEVGAASLRQRVADWRVKLRFHRADLYLGVAVLVAAAALVWPTVGSSPQPGLSTWQRALITLGIAEAPQPAVHLPGDPTVEVWIDTHSALYYCPGEEQYGKTPDGRFTSQREAQTDRFEPAGRLACE